MKRAVLEATRTSLRWLMVDGPSAAHRPRSFRVVPLAQELTAALIRQAAGTAVTAQLDLVAAIPRDQLITRLLKLPSTDPDELAGMVALNGTTQLPYPPEQVVYDFQVLEQRDGTSTVHLVACHRDVVERQLTTMRAAGLDPSLLAPTSWGVAGWYQRYGYSPMVAEPALIINIDADHTDLVLIQHGRVLASRSLGQGRDDWQTGEGLSLLGQELGLTVSGVRKELPGVDVLSYLLTGVGPLESWSQALAAQVGRPVVAVAPTAKIRMPESVGAQHASPVVALGLAAAEVRWCPNLLPPDARRAHLHRRRMRQWQMTGLLWIGSLVVAAGAARALARRQEQVDALLLDQAHRLEAVTRHTESQAHVLRQIEGVLSGRRRTAEALAALFRTTPPEIVFESVAFDRSREEFLLRGSAPSTRDVLGYLHQLEQAGLWAKVELRYSANRTGPDGDRTEFEIAVSGAPARTS